MSFPRYPAYKDSGVEWLGEVPAHWEVTPIRFVARLESGHTPSRQQPKFWQNCTVPWFSLGDVWQIRESGRSIIYETAEKISELGMANSAARLLPAGTVILSRTASVGFAAIMGIPMATTQDFANWVCGPRLAPEFLLHVFRAMCGEFNRLMYGSTHNTIYMPDIRSFRMAVPPFTEQRAIGAFLERETGKIDALVGEQEQLIELLKEKRQAVISHAVTKGLDPDAPMKDSGIEWLGQIPAHWELGPLKRSITKIEQGSSPNCLSDPAAEGEWGVLKVGCGNGHHFDPQEQKALPPEIAPEPQYEIKTGDILMSRGNTLDRVGAATLVPPVRPRLLLSDLLYRFRSRGPNARFIVMALRSAIGRFQIERAANGTSPSMKKIGQDTIRCFLIALPPVEEQRAIIDFVSQETAKIDALVGEAERAIALLQERRSALISAAVTGQIDVRDAAARAAA